MTDTAHIRPRKRNSNAATTTKQTSSTDNAVEETRQRIETWVGLATSHSEEEFAPIPPQPNNHKPPRKGILKKAKYAGTTTVTQSKIRPVVRDVVVERPRRVRAPRVGAMKGCDDAPPQRETKVGYHSQVDDSSKTIVGGGVTTTAQPTRSSSSNDELLTFNSVADLMEAAGTLPAPDKTDQTPPRVVEAGLEFSCMDPDEYQALQQEARHEQYGVMLGTTEESSSCWDLLDTDDDDDETVSSTSDEGKEVEPRAFLQLWNVLAQWVTPEAVRYVRHLRSHHDAPPPPPQVHRSDVDASRCAGLQALLQMHIQKSLVEDLQRPVEELRRAECRLADLIRCLDFSRPMPPLHSAGARALTCLLVATLLGVTNDGVLPDCCQVLGLSREEYLYLSQSAIVNFGTPDDDDNNNNDDNSTW